MHVCMCGNASKFLWDFTIMAGYHLPNNRPGNVYVSSGKHAYLNDIAIFGDGWMTAKF